MGREMETYAASMRKDSQSETEVATAALMKPMPSTLTSRFRGGRQQSRPAQSMMIGLYLYRSVGTWEL